MQEFKEFAVKGNVVDMAVGVIIGGAFGKIVSSLVGDVVMPIVGRIVGGVVRAALSEPWRPDLRYPGSRRRLAHRSSKYGAFINATIDFVIIAFVIFLAIKAINKLKRKEEEAPAEPAADPEDVVLLRDPRRAQAALMKETRREARFHWLEVRESFSFRKRPRHRVARAGSRSCRWARGEIRSQGED